MSRFFNNKNGLLRSIKCMAIILGLLGLFCILQGTLSPDNMEDYNFIPILLLVLVYFFYSIGPQRFANEYAEIIIPKKCYFIVRCMLVSISWLLIFIITKTIPYLIRFIGVGYLFGFMAVMCVLMSIFVRMFVIDVDQMSDKSRLVDNTSSCSNSETTDSETNSEV